MLKQAAEKALAGGLRPLACRRERGRVLVLAYHNVMPDGAEPGGDRSLHLPQTAFAAQLEALRETHRVVRLREALELLERNRAARGRRTPDSPLAAVTFDDAYRGALTCGLRELDRRNLPATVFVSPGRLGDEGFWWDRLAKADTTGGGGAHDGGIPSREALLRDDAGRSEAILGRARRNDWPLYRCPEHARPVTEDELVRAVGEHDLTVGAHGWTHANLAQLDGADLQEELDRPLGWLEATITDALLPVLAYPYGRYTAAVEEATSTAGYRAAFTVEGGSVAPGGLPMHRLPRTNVSAGVSVDGFRLRAFGVLT